MATDQAPNRANSTARLAAVAAGGALVWLAWLAASWSWADMHARQAFRGQTELLERSRQSGILPEYTEWQTVYREAQAALAIDGSNPDLLAQAADLLSMRTWDGAVYRDFSSESRDFWQQTAQLRPDSPEVWANLARIKYLNGEIDAILYGAIGNAVLLGPWEPEVQWSVLDTGFALWDEMSASQRESVSMLARNGERRYANEVLSIAERRGRLEIVCASAKLGNMATCRAKRGE